MILVFITPTPDVGVPDWRYTDKVVHFLLFLGFSLFLYLDRAPGPLKTFLISALFALSVELIQWFLPFRDVEWADFAAGAAGAGSACLVLFLLERRRVPEDWNPQGR